MNVRVFTSRSKNAIKWLKRRLMNRLFRLSVLLIGCLGLEACSDTVDVSACRTATTGWSAMEMLTVGLIGEHNTHSLKVRIADEPHERAAGYQWICPETARNSGVLFIFSQSFLAAFHMRNVYVPLNIAFFDADGERVSFVQMAPEPPGGQQSERLYEASKPFKYALEMPITLASDRLLRGTSLRLVLPQE